MDDGHFGHALKGVYYIAARLYMVSAVAAVVSLLGLALGFVGITGFVHQSLGAMIVAGSIWFVALAAKVTNLETSATSMAPAALTPPSE
ncbi:MAG: hypothetical protein ACKVP5_13350 [Aestuariivirga sp.]